MKSYDLNGSQAAAGAHREEIAELLYGGCTRLRQLGFILSLTLFASIRLGAGELTPIELRCDDMVNPLGVDAVPRFSWKLRSAPGEQGARQTAWQLRVGTWDSGRIESDDQVGIPYAGPPLHAHQQQAWQVRIWDAAGHVSAWSEAQTFTVGPLSPEDWAPAQWITDGELQRWERAKLGFSSQVTSDPDTTKWLQLDLGSPQAVDLVRLHAVRHTEVENVGFPSEFKLEASNEPEFREARVLFESNGRKANGDGNSAEIKIPRTVTRYLRLTVPHLRSEGGQARLALSQIEVIGAGRNLAPQAVVTASDSLENERWSNTAVVDGLGVPGANPRANGTLLLRRTFAVRPMLRRAVLHLSGLGHYQLEVNGRSVTSARMTPGWTDYEKAVLYDSYDVTAALRTGANAFGVTLGNGMYNVQPEAGRYTKFVGPYRPLKMIALLRMEYADGTIETIATDDHWRVSAGPITYAQIYGGEDYDARANPVGWSEPAFKESAWSAAVRTTGPGGALRGASHASPAFATFETLTPVSARSIRDAVTVYDLGQNASIMLHLKMRGPSGSRVKVVPAELLNVDGTVDRNSCSHGGIEASWNYTLQGREATEEDWQPAFFYHGSRYLQVECIAGADGGSRPEVTTIEGLVAHSDSPSVGEFACSNELFNRTHELIRWAQRSNLSHVITDCPHRERLGWLEQYHLNGPALRYEWDLGRLYRKGFDDMADAQTTEGLVPDIAPEYVKFSGGFRDSPEWGSAFILAAWQHFVWTGDDAPLRAHYDGMRRYLNYLETQVKDGLLRHGLGDWYDLGPKPPGRSQLTPIALTATAIYYEATVTLARIADRLGRGADVAELTRQATAIKAAFNGAFLDAKRGVYADGSQAAQALPLAIGLVPGENRAAVLGSLVRDIRNRGDSNTAGDVGYRYVLRALAENGENQLVFAMNNQSDKPGYGYQLAHDATSLTEAWDANPAASQNHFMLGQIMEWFYHDLAGLAPDPEAAGFKRVLIAPHPVAGVSWAQAAYNSPRGRIAVEWRQQGGQLTVEINLPPNTSGRVELPADPAKVKEGSRPFTTESSVKLISQPGNKSVFAVEAGHYFFVMPYSSPP